MVIAGLWRLEEDGITRPLIEIEVSVAGNNAVNEWFLVDSGADCTVFTSRLLARLALGLDALGVGSQLLGLGGESESVVFEATLQLETIEGGTAAISGKFLAATTPMALDVSILGRDVLANFDVIVSRRRNDVLLLASNHAYAVTG